MIIFQYDKTFEGLLTVVFTAYDYKEFPDVLMAQDEIFPLFYDKIYEVTTESVKSERVWKALKRKLSSKAISLLTTSWLADGFPKIDELLFRYIRKVIDTPTSIELNFGDSDVLQLSRVYKQVTYERMRMLQFLRFQKTSDGIYFAAFEPMHNVLPLTISHFKDRFADQKWVIYDMQRQYGFYYDLQEVKEVSFTEKGETLIHGLLEDKMMAEDERFFQELWKIYFKSIAIKERKNLRKQRQDMPVRYWKYLIEK